MTEVKDEIYHTRRYQPGDETAITALFGTVFGLPLTIAQWRWKYTGTGMTSPPVRLAFDRDGHLMGHAGAIPLRGIRHNRPLPFFQICDVMVHPAARGQLGQRNLFTRLLRELLSDLADHRPDVFAYGFPGRRPFRLGEYAQVYGLVEPVSFVCRPARRKAFSLLRTQKLDWNDPRLDKLWARRASDVGLGLIRDQAFLHWRYAANPFRTYELLGVILAGCLLGWAVTRQDGDRLKIIDLLTPRRWLKPVLATLDRLAATGGMTELEIALPHGLREICGGRREQTDIIVANMMWRLPISTAEVQETLHYTMGDLDIF